MNNKRDPKRLEKTRKLFNDLSQSEVNKWKVKREMSDKRRIQELQNQEMNEINKRIEELKREYHRVCSERGSAHKWAQLLTRQEFSHNSFITRRELMVKNRAKSHLNGFLKQNAIKQNEIKLNKEKEIEKRKDLMKSSLRKENVSEEDMNILRQLQKLQILEKSLRELIENKKELSHSEKSIEKNTEKLFWPQKPVSRYDLLESSPASVGSHQTIVQNEAQIQDQNQCTSDGKRDVCIQTINTEFTANSSPFDSIAIASKLYERLKSRQMTETQPKVFKIYKNAAIGTTTPLLSSNGQSLPEMSVGSSLTSYLSLPKSHRISNLSNKTTRALSEIYKRERMKKIATIDLESDSILSTTHVEDSTDPLLTRIKNLKDLINKKVEQCSGEGLAVEGQQREDINALQSIGDSPKITSESINSAFIQINPSRSQSLIISQNDSQVSKGKSFSRYKNYEENADPFSDQSWTSSVSFKTLNAISSSGRSSPFEDHISEKRDIQTSHLSEMSLNLAELSSNTDVESIKSSILFNSEPIRDRNIFWKEVFGRAGIEVNNTQIAHFFQTHNLEIDSNSDSLSLSSFSAALHSHSTPKRFK